MRSEPRFVLAFAATVLAACGSSSSPADPGASGGAGPGMGGAGGTGIGATGGSAGATGGSSGTTSAGGAGGGGATPASACAAWATTFCAKISMCTKLVDLAYGDLTICAKDVAESCLAKLTADGSSVTVANQESCTAAYKTATCADVDAGVSACVEPPGKRPPGSPCLESSQCDSKSCAHDPASTSSCGKCAKLVGVGQPCGPGVGTCDGDNFCGTNGCYKPTPAGGACYSDAQCATGLSCGVSGGPCHTSGLIGEACGPKIDDCNFAKGAVCNPGSAKCEAATFAFKSGDKCGFDSSNGHRTVCGAGLSCSNNGDIKLGLCQKATLAEGQSCTVGSGSPSCEHSLVCVGGVCSLPSKVSCN